MKPLHLRSKTDIAILSQSLAGAATSRYYNMSKYPRAIFKWSIGVLAAAGTSVAQIMEATDAAGAGAQAIVPAIATITANIQATEIALTIVTAAGGVHVAGQTVTINGCVFTAAAADVPAARTYAVGASGADSAAALLAKINSANPDIGVPGVTGVSAIDGANTVLTLTVDDPGELTITAAASAATTVVSTVSATGYVEVDASQMDTIDGFTHIAVTITNSAASQTAAFIDRFDGRWEPVAQVAAGN
jgi:hypothetical protein